MSNSKETGYVPNLGSFQELIDFVTAMLAGYAPNLVRIQIASMISQLSATRTINKDYDKLENNWKLAVNDNEVNFKQSSKKATRVLATFKSSGSTPENVENVKSLCDTIRGWRHTKMPKIGTPEFEATISTSHQGMDNLIRTWGQLIDFLSKVPVYLPDLPELTVAGLTTWRGDCIDTLSLDKSTSKIYIEKAKERNEAFDLEPTGICPIAQQVRDYIKGKFGADSYEYHHVTMIKFRRHPL